MRNLILVMISLLLCRCASMEKSIGLGVGIGAASGIASSQIANYNSKGTVVLGLGGAVIGGIIAALLHKDQPEIPPSMPATSVLKNNPPPLKNAEEDVLWVPDKIEGDHFEEGHRVFVIKKPAHWQLRSEEKGVPVENGESGESDE